MTAIGLVSDIAHDLLKIVYVWLPITFDPSIAVDKDLKSYSTVSYRTSVNVSNILLAVCYFPSLKPFDPRIAGVSYKTFNNHNLQIFVRS
jgi:hypothetical protein